MLSPVALAWVASDSSRNPLTGYDWALLSNVGQAYGAVSAVFAALALVGVGGSLAFQARQVRIAQLQATQAFQFELFRTAYEHPDLHAGWSPAAGTSYEQWRRNTYRNLVFAYLQMGYEMGTISEGSLRRMLANRFRAAEARTWWPSARDAWRRDAHSRRQRRFVTLVDEAHGRAMTAPPSSTTAPLAPARLLADAALQRHRYLLGGACAVIAASLFGLRSARRGTSGACRSSVRRRDTAPL